LAAASLGDAFEFGEDGGVGVDGDLVVGVAEGFSNGLEVGAGGAEVGGGAVA
jgi:hypothetical protein